MCFHSKQSKDAQTLQKRFNAQIERPELFTTGDINGFEHPSVLSDIRAAGRCWDLQSQLIII